MLCKICKGDSMVKDSRDAGPFKLRRRRECLECGARWTTYETEVTKDDQDERCSQLEKTVSQIRALVAAA